MDILKKWLGVCFAVLCYLAGNAAFVYFILYINDLHLDETVNAIESNYSMAFIIFNNLFALSIFGFQHSIMARSSFKSWLKGFVSAELERPFYMLGTALAICLTCLIWIPVGDVVWRVESTAVETIIRTIGAAGWLFSFAATFMINHFELFGLSQSYNFARGKDPSPIKFKTPGFYKVVRHPIQTGILIGMWAVPFSTTSHILFASGFTLYVFIGLYFEEKDLIREFGKSYIDYKKQVRGLVPFKTNEGGLK